MTTETAVDVEQRTPDWSWIHLALTSEQSSREDALRMKLTRLNDSAASYFREGKMASDVAKAIVADLKTDVRLLAELKAEVHLAARRRWEQDHPAIPLPDHLQEP